MERWRLKTTGSSSMEPSSLTFSVIFHCRFRDTLNIQLAPQVPSLHCTALRSVRVSTQDWTSVIVCGRNRNMLCILALAHSLVFHPRSSKSLSLSLLLHPFNPLLVYFALSALHYTRLETRLTADNDERTSERPRAELCYFNLFQA